MPASLLPSEAAFDALENSLKTVLLHTGSALNKDFGADGPKMISTKIRLEHALPDALSKWHGALDQLEDQLVRHSCTRA